MAKNSRKKVLSCDRPKSLHKQTLNLYHNRPRAMTVEMIALGTGLPVHWLNSFAKTKKPSVNRVQVLYEFFVNAPINI